MNYIYADTETGGLFAAQHALLSLAAVGPMNEVFAEYITPESQPGKEVDPEAVKKNGFTRELWEEYGARPLVDVLRDFAEWTRQTETDYGPVAIVAHNAAFERAFLSEAERVTGIAAMHRDRWRCTQLLMSDMMDRGLILRGSSRLDRLAALSGWPGHRHKHHEALQDAFITQHGHRWLLELQGLQAKNLRELYEVSLSERRKLEDLILGISDYLNGAGSLDDTSRFNRLVCERADQIRTAKASAQKEEGREDG